MTPDAITAMLRLALLIVWTAGMAALLLLGAALCANDIKDQENDQ